MRLYPSGCLKCIFNSKFPDRPHALSWSLHIPPSTLRKNPWSYSSVAHSVDGPPPLGYMSPHTAHTSSTYIPPKYLLCPSASPSSAQTVAYSRNQGEGAHSFSRGDWEVSEERECLSSHWGIEGLLWAQGLWVGISGRRGGTCRCTELGEHVESGDLSIVLTFGARVVSWGVEGDEAEQESRKVIHVFCKRI